MVTVGYNPSTGKVLMCASGKVSEGCCGSLPPWQPCGGYYYPVKARASIQDCVDSYCDDVNYARNRYFTTYNGTQLLDLVSPLCSTYRKTIVHSANATCGGPLFSDYYYLCSDPPGFEHHANFYLTTTHHKVTITRLTSPLRIRIKFEFLLDLPDEHLFAISCISGSPCQTAGGSGYGMQAISCQKEWSVADWTETAISGTYTMTESDTTISTPSCSSYIATGYTVDVTI